MASSGPSAEARRKLDQIVQVSLLFEGGSGVCEWLLMSDRTSIPKRRL